MTVTFLPSTGPQTKCAMFQITDDDIALEGDECFSVTCEAGMMPCPEGMVTIEDNDGKLVFKACSARLGICCTFSYFSCDSKIC